jgi:hypothetical protein
MSITTGMYLTHAPSGPNPRPSGARGPAGRPGFESAQPGTWLTRLYIGSQGMIRGLKAVEAKRSGRLAVHLLQTNLAKSVEAPLCPYIGLPMVEDSAAHTTCSSPLAKVSV